MQDSQANCGPFALKNALAAIGIERSAEELEKACKTSATKGTPTKNVVGAVKSIDGCTPVLIRERKRDIALLRLRGALDEGRPVLLVWADGEGNPGEHWVAAVGMLGRRYLIADAAENELVLSLGVEEVAGKWCDGGTYEAVVL
jgi:hypothetical protein